jgi:hypothetical protein
MSTAQIYLVASATAERGAIHGSNGSTKTPSYKRRHQRRARESHTVNDWKRLRFETDYPEPTADVLLADGRVATGKTRLERVRRSYEAQ